MTVGDADGFAKPQAADIQSGLRHDQLQPALTCLWFFKRWQH
jgi:hypothetical protein